MAFPTLLILMGVSGSGKTTIGQALALRLGWIFEDGDRFHSPRNVAKMHAGIALTDEDRRPWLDALHDFLSDCVAKGQSVVLACSALKNAYRDQLNVNGTVRFVYLKVDRDVLIERLAHRKDHYFNPALLDSQLKTLEEPRGAMVVNANQPVEHVVAEIAQNFGG